MLEAVFKVAEVVGTSDASISEAITSGIEKANLSWCEVTHIRSHVEDGEVHRYQVTRNGFRLEE